VEIIKSIWKWIDLKIWRWMSPIKTAFIFKLVNFQIFKLEKCTTPVFK
jgi:hypothetical protein